MPFCQSCGSNLNENQAFCSSCGSKASNAEQPQANQSAQNTQAPPVLMSCPYCGFKNQSDARACRNCNGVLASQNQQGHNAPPPYNPHYYSNQPGFHGQGFNQYNPLQSVGYNGIAIAGFVCGLLSLALYIFFPLPIIAFILSLTGIIQTKNNVKKGRGLAIAGLVTAAVGILFCIFFYVDLYNNVNEYFFYDYF